LAGTAARFSSGRPEQGNPNQRNTPLVTELCEGQITVTDAAHPLFGKVLRLTGIAYLSGHIRHCQVEFLPGQFAYVPFGSSNLSAEPRPQSSVLTATAIAELVSTFQAVATVRRTNHAKRK
jgi:hypothetical protein